MASYRLVPRVHHGEVWYDLEQRVWLFWKHVWGYQDKDRAINAMETLVTEKPIYPTLNRIAGNGSATAEGKLA